jgi:Nucleoside 2-deoxyribosyltransferase like
MLHIGLRKEAKEYKAPYPYDITKKTVFLAGSIEEGTAVDWQAEAAAKFIKAGIDVLNPRRKNFKEVEQSMEDAYLTEQIVWELKGLDSCTDILMNFCKDTNAPITLLELGLYADSGRLIVVCPDGFYRQANVELVCTKHNIPFFTKINKAINYIIYK